MAWTAPRTYVAGEILTAAILNVDHRDNILALDAGRIAVTSQAAHDLFAASSATQKTRIANGSTGQVLTATTSAIPSWKSTPRVSVTDSNSSQSHATSGAWQALLFNSEDYDTDTMHDTGSNTSRLVATTAGVYVFSGGMAFAAHATGRRKLRVVANAATVPQPQTDLPAPASGGIFLSIAGQVTLTAGQYIELEAWQDSGGALNMDRDAGNTPRFAMARIGN